MMGKVSLICTLTHFSYSGTVLLPGAQWLIDDFSLASATLFIFLLFFHTVRIIHWDMGTILVVGFVPQIISGVFQWGFHNVMRYRNWLPYRTKVL